MVPKRSGVCDMMLSALKELVPGSRLVGPDVCVRRAAEDSRAIRGGELFVAVPGRTRDGRDFAEEAARRGAAALAVEAPVGVELPQLVVPNASEALGPLAAALAGSPAEELRLVGVTGTNGKTTIAHLIASILREAGREVGVMGTLGYEFAGGVEDAPYTTPPPPLLHATLAKMARAGCTDVALEVSSAALAMDRLEGAPFCAAAYSNLSREHLDIHGSLEAYRDAKARLFTRHLAPGAPAVIFADDPHAEAMIEAAGDRPVWRVSLRSDAEAEIRALTLRADLAGVRVRARAPAGDLDLASERLFGVHNAQNLLLAAGLSLALGIDREAIERGVAAAPEVPGRLERVPTRGGPEVFVDYAHTPAALENALAALRPLTPRRLFVVFGCGGDRDREKRPEMGAIAEAGADVAIATSDNPRSEDPNAILAEIAAGMRGPRRELDRRAAIAEAVTEAGPGDVVLIAGKGHETYQIVGDRVLSFDDREEARRAAEGRLCFTAAEIAAIAGGEVAAGDPATEFYGVVIDGRRAGPGDLYVAIRGARLDGHDFCAQAAEAGAAGAVVERGRASGLPATVEVEDTTRALGAIAREHARRWRALTGGRVVAVTGSSGKTTTVALAAAALGASHRVHKSEGSHNNETGVPLTLLGLRADHDAAVVEMGMRGLGQIAYLADFAEPEVGVVLNAQTAHVGVVGSTEAIAEGKSELFSSLAPGGAAIYPAGDPRLASRASRAPRRIAFGAEETADLRMIRYEPEIGGSRVAVADWDGTRAEAFVPLVGRHNAENATAALAAARALGVPLSSAAASVARAATPAMRAEVAEVAGRRVFVDCYNANPASAEAALEAVAERRERGARAVAVLGDMLELGDGEEAAHRDLGRLAAALGFAVVALGERAEEILDGARGAGGAAARAEAPEGAAEDALARTRSGDWILLKASRGARLERVLDVLRARAGGDDE